MVWLMGRKCDVGVFRAVQCSTAVGLERREREMCDDDHDDEDLMIDDVVSEGSSIHPGIVVWWSKS